MLELESLWFDAHANRFYLTSYVKDTKLYAGRPTQGPLAGSSSGFS